MRNTVSRSFAVGIVAAVLLYGVGSLEVPIMVATIMPGIYFGFAYLQGSWVEVLQETVTCGVLISIYLYCLHHVHEWMYLAPLSVGVHGLVDLLHHFHLYPSETHVHRCAPEYPLMCASVDLAICVTMSALLYLRGA